ncbi:hypothetical protein LTR84_001460 [Exophiala bonariae]|uniref:Alpha/beta hydrolase fold-3 domain-containing protein n=1 Tax=Exophiala bonariae TaxID=1690606 RepID=A0AAV9NH63_9EURO|nr:hypothetical protein LTR84_001460 [Exophiala bonariae]
MPDIKWNILLKNPAIAVKILLLGSWRSVLILLARIVVPFRARKLTLRNAFARAWIRTAHSAHSKVFCSEPWSHNCQEVVLAGSTVDTLHEKPIVGGWVIPNTDVDELKQKDAVIVFAHGGGYAIGHGLQNASAFRRWVGKAKSMGQEIAIVTVKYRKCLAIGKLNLWRCYIPGMWFSRLILPSTTALSGEKQWPAQRDSFMAMYEWLLQQGVSPSKIVFSGTSAGGEHIYSFYSYKICIMYSRESSHLLGGLILLAMLYIRDHTNLPQPRCAVAHSPWTDVSSALTGVKGHPLLDTDYIDTYDQTCVAMNDLLRPDGLPFNTPEISPVLAKDVSRLPPQLVFYGDAEILMTDSMRWIKRSRDAGVRIDVHVGKGEMHTYSNGWPVGGRRTELECDELMLNYIFSEVALPL